jgi:hypothetical protein
MKPSLLYRIAAGFFVLVAAGHTYGFLAFKPPTPEAVAVRNAMANVHFQVGNASFSYGGFYIGFGLFVSAYLLFSALLAWHLAGLAGSEPQSIGTLGWSFSALQLVSVVLSRIYFSMTPTLFFAVAAALCVAGASQSVRAARLRRFGHAESPAHSHAHSLLGTL